MLRTNSSGLVMISTQWRQRLTYTAMSMLLGWHALAMVVAPASRSSDMVKSLRRVLSPYQAFFNLDHKWNFFCADCRLRTDQLRYVIRDDAGHSHTFVPSAKWSWFHPGYIWFIDWDRIIIGSPHVHGIPFAEMLCREHASLRPVSVTLLKVEEREFKPADHLNGKHPLDPEFTTVSTLKSIRCARS
jgi:hypothetical protein